jgi:hypothetical protein
VDWMGLGSEELKTSGSRRPGLGGHDLGVAGLGQVTCLTCKVLLARPARVRSRDIRVKLAPEPMDPEGTFTFPDLLHSNLVQWSQSWGSKMSHVP